MSHLISCISLLYKQFSTLKILTFLYAFEIVIPYSYLSLQCLLKFLHWNLDIGNASVGIFTVLTLLKVLYHRRGCKICFSEIFLQDPYLNKITHKDPFR